MGESGNLAPSSVDRLRGISANEFLGRNGELWSREAQGHRNILPGRSGTPPHDRGTPPLRFRWFRARTIGTSLVANACSRYDRKARTGSTEDLSSPFPFRINDHPGPYSLPYPNNDAKAVKQGFACACFMGRSCLPCARSMRRHRLNPRGQKPHTLTHMFLSTNNRT